MLRTAAPTPERRWLATALAAALLAGGLTSCALDWSFTHLDVDGGRTDASLDAGVLPGSDGSVDPPDTAPTRDAAQATDGAGAEAQADAASGCHSNAECAPGSFCHYKDHLCGTGLPGTCIPRPSASSCPASTPYACGCDGNVDVTGPCGAESGGVDVTTRPCTTSPGTQCGYVYCVTACIQGTAANGETTFDCQ
jgi:hypothetical protein